MEGIVLRQFLKNGWNLIVEYLKVINDMADSEEDLKSLLMRVKEESERMA